jgi:putative hydrolase of the HAD superfamily
MNRNAIIFDGDDTLWETMSHYSTAKEEFLKQMISCGFDRLAASAQFETIDVNNVRGMGFSRHRFPHSMVETYRYFCKRIGNRLDQQIEEAIRQIGYRVFDMPPIVFEDAAYVLESLKSSHCLILATKGDREVQTGKINQSGLAHYFDAIYIFEQKGMAEFKTIIDDRGLSTRSCWSIGNSLRSDINPALEVGLSAIWIPRHTWDYEIAEESANPRFYKADRLIDCLEILRHVE